MRKKIVAATLTTAVLGVSIGFGAYAASKTIIIVNGKVADVEAKTIDGTTYVPLRAAAELLDAHVRYDEKAKAVLITSKWTPEEDTASSDDGTEYRAGDFVFSRVNAEKSEYGWKIDTVITNPTDKTISGVFTVTFYDASGKRLGDAKGAVDKLVPEASMPFTLMTSDDLSGYASIKFEAQMI